MPGEGNTLQSCLANGFCLFQIPCHTHAEEAIRVLLLHLGEIFVLIAVNHLLNHHSGTHLCVIHVREEHLS